MLATEERQSVFGFFLSIGLLLVVGTAFLVRTIYAENQLVPKPPKPTPPPRSRR
jgi:hypothetical protein